MTARLFLGEADLDEPLTAVILDQQQHAGPAGIERVSHRFRKVGRVLHAALTEPLDDVANLKPFGGGWATLDDLGHDNACCLTVEAKLFGQLRCEVVDTEDKLIKALGLTL